MTTINQSFNKTDRTPYIELEKIGNRIYIDFDYGLSEGSNDLYDGEVTYSLGKTEKNDKIENEFDSELNLNFYHVISPGKAITGKYELDDFNSGTSITFDFKMISYDEKAKYNGPRV
ncbi:hypothetical protein [Rhizobium sp. G21]|uniref:hypothetical protein n=1 Tax=Rhizobium sp. G21 TaxID=2758439 RepID=UPI0015FF2CD1|nr:hypothetical protein [Rhizobium sp. G21]MBB1248445.1 hypothetical protein [Rhizobium sp. G21]